MRIGNLNSPIIFWFRRDLRLSDNEGLRAAALDGRPIIPLFIWSPLEEGEWEIGAASKWWLHHSLRELSAQLDKLGSQLTIRVGSSIESLREVARETKATLVYCNELFEPHLRTRDQRLREALATDAISISFHQSSLLLSPDDFLNSQRKPFQMFTPFFKKLRHFYRLSKPLSRPDTKNFCPPILPTLAISELKLLPQRNWDLGFYEIWKPGEKGAHSSLRSFLSRAISAYHSARDFPEQTATSRLSAYLHFGEISPRQVFWAVESLQKKGKAKNAEHFLRQIAWREFSYYLMFHFPHSTQGPLRKQFKKFPWRKNNRYLRAWQKGETGYPIVDAGMKELWITGTMHNRVRMIAASFLVKHLLQPWELGARWFWDTLVDADLANNTMGWQWVAGCGADAAPYFRIFNPITQGEKFDPHGNYVRRWVPALSRLNSKWIHKPWESPQTELKKANITLGRNYPKPIVDHFEARERALDAYYSFTTGSKTVP